ncbi:unnamed protein product [Phaeothamnion confervicola]
MRVAQHVSAVASRRARAWAAPGPTTLEWLFHVLVQMWACEDDVATATAHLTTGLLPVVADIAGAATDAVAAAKGPAAGTAAATPAVAAATAAEATGVRRWSEEGMSRVRRALERAAAHPRGRYCPLLWRCYLQSEVGRGCFARAKRVYMRAIHACPWSKRLWLDACRMAVLRRTFGVAEAADLMEVLLEKGVGAVNEPPPFHGDEKGGRAGDGMED